MSASSRLWHRNWHGSTATSHGGPREAWFHQERQCMPLGVFATALQISLRRSELANAKSSRLMSSQSPRVLQRPYREISVVVWQLWNRQEGTREKNEVVGWGLLRFANCVDVKNLYIYLELKICWHYQCVMGLTMLPITPGLRWTDLSIMLLQTS